MMFEIVILLEIIAFVFLALGLVPIKGDPLSGESNKGLLNKIIFIGVSTIIFFMLGILSASYEYTFCYINQTISFFDLNSTISTATCGYHNIENTGLAFFNYFMAIITLVIGLIISLFILRFKDQKEYDDS